MKKQTKKNILYLLYIVVGFYAVAGIVAVIFHKDWTNPLERNYLYFENEDVETVVDSLNNLREILYSIYEGHQGYVYFEYKNDSIMVRKDSSHKYKYGNRYECIDENEYFKDIDVAKLNRIRRLFDYCYENNIRVDEFNSYWNALTGLYKPYYWMYGTKTNPGDLIRILVVSSRPDFIESRNRWPYKTLDTYKNAVLYTSQDDKIWGDSIPYKVNYKKE